MAAQSTTETPPSQESPEMCHLCQLPVPETAKRVHEKTLHHQAAQQVAAVALDRWRAHMTASSALTDPASDDGAATAENVTYCDICTEAVPSASYTRHVTSRPHLISALDNQVFEELVRLYIDEEELKFLEAPEQEVGDDSAAVKDDAAIKKYTCHICALQVPSAFKPEHERSVHHRTRVALATAAARRTSAFLHNQTPIGVAFKRNIKMTDLLKSYTGTDLSKKPVEEKNEDFIEKEVEEKASQVEFKKRLTAKQYFTDILPYLQYTEALYTIVVDDTDYVTIKNTNGTCLRVHVANFNGIYSNSSNDVHYDLKCRMCNGYNQYMTYSSEKDHDKLHVMSLGHIRHLLTPIDNMHGIRKIHNGHSLCVVCNAYMPEHALENHIFNDIHHTAALAEALTLGRDFKEGKDDLKIVIYTSPPVERTNYMNNPIRNFPHNNVVFGGGVSYAQDQVNVGMPQGPTSKPRVGLFGVSKQSSAHGKIASAGPASTGTIFGAQASTETFGSDSAGTGFGASTANTGTTFGSAPASNGKSFGSVQLASTGFGASFGANSATTQSVDGSPAGAAFGSSTTSNDSGVNTANSFSFGATPASTGTGIYGANPASIGPFGANTASNGAFGANTASSGGLFSASNTAFGDSSANSAGNTDNGTFGTGATFSNESPFNLDTKSGDAANSGSSLNV